VPLALNNLALGALHIIRNSQGFQYTPTLLQASGRIRRFATFVIALWECSIVHTAFPFALLTDIKDTTLKIRMATSRITINKLKNFFIEKYFNL